jgi:hypothetical protein
MFSLISALLYVDAGTVMATQTQTGLYHTNKTNKRNIKEND